MTSNQTAIPNSVVEQEPRNSTGYADLSLLVAPQADVLLPWGTYERDWQLRRLYRALHNTLIQGSIAGLVKKIKATPWEVQGGRNSTRRAQEYLQDAQFEHGWGMFISKILLDYLTQDKGAFMEIQGPGRPDRPLTGRATGIAHLDSGRCYLTGNLEFPVVYWSRVTNTLHRLHRTRVHHLVDMPDADERYFNRGLCALSRMVGVSVVQIGMSKYQTERLSNLPPAGILTISGMTMDKYQQAREAFEAGRVKQGASIWSGVMQLASPNPNNPLKIELFPFANLPEQFDYAKYMDAHVNLVALALGVDRQEIWTLNSGNLGTATQSVVLAEKARGKAFADILSMMERALNTWVLPESLEFQFKFQDTEADRAQADRAQTWVNIANSAPGLSDEQRLMLLAANVEALADVILDEDGQVKLPDDDPKADTDEPDIQATDDSPIGTEDEMQVSNGQRAVGRIEDRLSGLRLDWLPVERQKDYEDTAAEFYRNLVDLFNAGANGDIPSRRFDTVMRAQLSRLGRRAYRDGLEDGGVTTDLLEGEDATAFAGWLARQSRFITDLTTSIYQTDPSPGQLQTRASMWVNKGLQEAYDLGLVSADGNGLYEFGGEDGAESCRTCQRLKGQRHRLKDWTRKRLRPGVDTDNFECGGWQCQHRLNRVEGRARGRF